MRALLLLFAFCLPLSLPAAEKPRVVTSFSILADMTRAVGGIDDPHAAESILAEGKADLVALGRAMLADPRWPWRAAAALGAPLHHIHQYARSAPLLAKWTAPQARQTAA